MTLIMNILLECIINWWREHFGKLPKVAFYQNTINLPNLKAYFRNSLIAY